MGRLNWDRVRVEQRERVNGVEYANDLGDVLVRAKASGARQGGHNRADPSPNTRPMILCPKCPARLASQDRLVAHLRKVHGERKGVPQRAQLARERAMSTGTSQFLIVSLSAAADGALRRLAGESGLPPAVMARRILEAQLTANNPKRR